MSLVWRSSLLALLTCVALVGCGGDDSDEEPAAGSGGNGGSSGTNGGSSGNGGTGGDESGGTGGAGSGGMNGGGMGGGGGFEIMCLEPMQTTPITCGGTECPIPEGLFGMDACMRSCCIMNSDGQEVCGTKSTIEQMPTECGAPPAADQRCPDYTDMLGTMREGCCNDMNQCGAVSTLTNACVTESPLIPDLPMPPPACDAAGEEDAGTN